MNCKFNKNFNSWEPENISKTKNLLTKDEIKKMERL